MTQSTPEHPRPWWRHVVRPVAISILVYGAVLLVMVFLQRSLMYPAMKSEPLAVSSWPVGGLTGSDVVTTTSDGLTLHGWMFRHADSAETPRPIVLFFHGNGGNRQHRVRHIALLTEQGADVVIFDYRGYGENAGSPSEAGLARDARAAWSFATDELNIPAERVVLFGESLGGGVAVPLAAELSREGTPPGGLIIRSSFSSMVDAAAEHYPWLPVRWVLRDRYESINVIGDVTCPILVLHGDADKVVPLRLGKKLFAAAPAQSATGVAKRFVRLPGAGHNNVLATHGDAISQAIDEFLAPLRRKESAHRAQELTAT